MGGERGIYNFVTPYPKSYIPNFVKISPVVLEEKMLKHDDVGIEITNIIEIILSKAVKNAFQNEHQSQPPLK